MNKNKELALQIAENLYQSFGSRMNELNSSTKENLEKLIFLLEDFFHMSPVIESKAKYLSDDLDKLRKYKSGLFDDQRIRTKHDLYEVIIELKMLKGYDQKI